MSPPKPGVLMNTVLRHRGDGSTPPSPSGGGVPIGMLLAITYAGGNSAGQSMGLLLSITKPS